ncbi:hypothetical protein TcWFU_010029 [Taenia crassiceps]|uniref:Uncharacterized protein n=1 Tax=Taenia crassiceps TaxID=6207 RepID=A0ABR4QC80_9CEST
MNEERFVDPAVADLYNSLVNTSVNDPYEDALRFLEFVRSSKNSGDCIMNLRLDAHTLVSTGATPRIIERHMKFLLLVQFEYTKSLPSHDPDSVDYKFSDWAAQILGRLSICSFERSDWKDFIKNDLVDRFASTHGKTLAQIYMDIGLEPPPCLPQLDEVDADDGDGDKVVDDPFGFPMLNLENPCLKASSREMPSPRTAKISARNSLPRALFSDSIIVASNEGTSWPSTSQTSPGPPAMWGKILMPASKYSTSKSRRKARTPVKRGSGQLIRSPMVGTGSRSRRRRIPSGSHGSSGQRKSLHRSVTETPNPKTSQPRWERARMAAAKKTKGRLVIVAESPLKPSEPGSVISSPLRRLWRASSLLNFRRGDLSGGDSGSGASSASRLSVKAELWQRRQMEEEASLSQFSGGESNLSQSVASSAASISSPQLRRRTSNLMANLISLCSPQSSAKNMKKPTLSSMVSSPPVLNLSKFKSEFSQLRPPPVSSKGLFRDLDAISSTTTSTPSTSVKTPTKRPSTTGSTPKRSKTGLRGQMAVAEVFTSPHVFDEAAMFPGEGEFFRRTAIDLERSSLQGKIQLLGGGDPCATPKKCVPLLPSSSGSDDENFQSTTAKRIGEVTPSRRRNPFTPAGNTSSMQRSEASWEQLSVGDGGGGPFKTPRKRVLCLPSPGSSGSKVSQPTAVEAKGGYETSLCFQDSLSPAANTCSAFQSKTFGWSPSACPTSATKGSGILSSHQVAIRQITPRKDLFHPTVNPLQALSPGVLSISGPKGRGSLSSDQVTVRQTTPRKGLFRPTVITPQLQAQGNIKDGNEAADSPRRRLRARRSLF